MAIGGDRAIYFVTSSTPDAPSALWRISYTGDEKTSIAPVQPTPADVAALHKLRNQLADYQGTSNPRIIPRAWSELDHADRAVRYAARVALEHQDPKQWVSNYKTATGTNRILQASVALARAGKPEHKPLILERLSTLEWSKLSASQKVDLLRAYGLAFARLGDPSDEERKILAGRFAKALPSGNQSVDIELSRLLVYLQSAPATGKVYELMATTSPP